MRKGLVLSAAAVLASFCSTPLLADIAGFYGPWDPVDSQGNLINYGGGPLIDGATFAASLSSDHSTLTMTFYNPTGGFSVFSNYIDDTVLPTGTVSYDWSVDFEESGQWIFETDVDTHIPGNDSLGYFDAGTYTGAATLDYTTGSYFSFGNIGFGNESPQEAVVTLTNFQYTGDATVPEPGTIGFLGAGLLVLGLACRFRKLRTI